MSPRLLARLAPALLALTLAACGDDAEQSPAATAPTAAEPAAAEPTAAERTAAEPTPPAPSPEVARGRQLYTRYCALCHADQAQGYAADHANALNNPEFLAIADDAFLRAAITDGRPGTPMSAWGRAHGGPLGPAEVDALVSYLRSLASRPAVDVSGVRVNGSAERGAPLYAQHCQECHGARGEGSDVATSISHPNFHRTASDGFIRYSIEHGRPGTPMPAFGSQLPAQAIDDLVAHVRTLEHAPDRPITPGGDPPPGLEDLVINPRGRPPTFTLREGRYVAADAVHQALRQGRRMVLIDARATSDWANGHIPGAAPFPFYDIAEMAERLPRDGTWILAYCACPHAASGHVVDALRQRGFENTAVIDEGILYWIDRGYPIERGSMPEGAAAAPHDHHHGHDHHGHQHHGHHHGHQHHGHAHPPPAAGGR